MAGLLLAHTPDSWVLAAADRAGQWPVEPNGVRSATPPAAAVLRWPAGNSAPPYGRASQTDRGTRASEVCIG
jgi:hypothetical protein